MIYATIKLTRWKMVQCIPLNLRWSGPSGNSVITRIALYAVLEATNVKMAPSTVPLVLVRP